MSSTFVADSVDDKDESLIIIVNPDGTITVDPETLQKLIANQHRGNVSVVRVDGEGNQTPTDSQDDLHVNLTVEGFYPPVSTQQPPSTPELDDITAGDGGDVVVDPFSQMDPEQLARLETALQSEQAKEILGTNLADNMLGDVGVGEVLAGTPGAPESVVHNDHSYTSAVQSPVKAPPPAVTTPAPRARGRGRGRGRGVLTRGGIIRGSGVQVIRTLHPAQPPQPSVVPQAGATISIPKTIATKKVLIHQGGKLVAAPSPTTGTTTGPKLVQRRLIIPKMQQTIQQVPSVQTTSAAPIQTVESKAVVSVQKSEGTSEKKPPTIIRRGGGRGRGRGRGAKVLDQRQLERNKVLDEEMAATLHALDVSPPPSEPIKRKEASVLVKKLSPRTIESATSGNKSVIIKSVKSRDKPQPLPKSSRKSADSTTTPAGAPPKTPTTPSPAPNANPLEIEDEKKKKKDKKDKNISPAVPQVLGPELFSTPDIIRRVGGDKPEPGPPQQPVAPTQKQVVVQPAASQPQLPTQPTKGDDVTPESLLDSIHAEVAKDDNRFLAEALLLDDLTSDDNITTTDNMAIGSNIEETLKRMESNGEKILSKVQETKTKEEDGLKTTRKLPPVELPATRLASKKAAAAATPTTKHHEPVKIVLGSHKKNPITKEKRPSTDTKKPIGHKPGSESDGLFSSSGRKRKVTEKMAAASSMDSDEEGESDEESYNSEDDPDRLWCICQKPHNNRFMICCDTCEEWFHGKCVGITKILGEQMEEQGIEWSCPNCKASKEKAVKDSSVKPTHIVKVEKPKPDVPVAQPKLDQSTIGHLECHVCKKPARANSIYCSDICIRKHVLNTLVIIKEETDKLTSTSRVVVYEKKTGRLLSGEKSPTVEGLVDWLLAHQTFEVLRPSALPGSKFYQKQQASAPPVPKPSAPKPQQQLQNKPSNVSVLKQTVLTTKSVAGAKQLAFTTKPAVTQKPGGIQLVQPQPQKVVSTPKGQARSDQVFTVEKDGKVRRVVKGFTGAPGNSAAPGSPDTSSSTSSSAPSKTVPKAKLKIQRKERKRKDSVEAGAKIASTNDKPEEAVTEPSKPQPEPIRANVKRTLQELLNQRVKEDPQLNIPNEEIKELSTAIEEELFNYFKDTGAKYKSKYRSLVFNIKDPKNLTLYKKIVDKALTPSQLVKLTPEELASQELAQWREKEAKHQIEIIKKNELDLIHQAKTVVLKSRKGEEVIETKNHEANISELESALNRTAEDYEAFEKAPAEKKETDEELLKLAEKLKNKEKKEERSRKSDRRKDKKSSKDDKKKDRGRSHSRSHRSRSHSHEKGKRRHSLDRKKDDKMKKEEKLEEVKVEPAEEKPVLDLSEEAEVMQVVKQEDPMTPPGIKEDSDMSDREPTSTVNINTPPYMDGEKAPIWKGFLNMTEVTKLYTTAYEVSGTCEDLGDELSDHLECVGRIQPDSVWDYVSRMKKAGTKEIVVIRFSSSSEEEKMNYLSLYSYLNSRNRMAVIGNVSRTVKDFYVLPLASHSPIPQVLLPLDGPGFEDYRPHLLLGIIVRSRKENHEVDQVIRNQNVMPSSSHSSYSSRKRSKRVAISYRSKTPERSYTPPLPDGGGTPPLRSDDLTPPLPDDDEPYSPGEDDPYSPGDGDDDDDKIVSSEAPDLQRNLDEVNRMIEQKRLQIESITSGTVFQSPGDEEAYSPSASFTPPPTGETIPFFDSKALPDISLPSNIQEILASIKSSSSTSATPTSPVLDPKSDPIVKAYTSSKMYFENPGEDEDEEETGSPVKPTPDVATEPVTDSPSGVVTSRDPRQRPETKSKMSLSQLSDAELIRKAAEMEEKARPENVVLPPPLPVIEEDFKVKPAPPPFYPAYPTAAPPYPAVAPVPFVPPPPLPAVYSQAPPGKYPSKFGPDKSGPPHSPHSDRVKRKLPDVPDKGYKMDPPGMKRSRRSKWEGEGPPPPPRMMHRGGPPRGMGHPMRPPMIPMRGRFRGFDRGSRFGRFPRGRGGYRGGDYRPKFDGIQSEWEEEIRNFEQRKNKEAERRKRRPPSRSPSPPRRRSRSRSPRRRSRRSSS